MLFSTLEAEEKIKLHTKLSRKKGKVKQNLKRKKQDKPVLQTQWKGSKEQTTQLYVAL